MLICPNCNHQNPEGAVQCEACYTPLPATTSCPNCGAPVQTDASFCGQCGSNLQAQGQAATIPSRPIPDPLIAPSPVNIPDLEESGTIAPPPALEIEPIPPTVVSGQASPDPTVIPDPSAPATVNKTQLQQQQAWLFHVQTNSRIEIPSNLTVVHLGKPNDQIPPDIDVSGFPNSEIVSRHHADIRVEGDAYFLEDVGSSNGTYINHSPLPKGNRHRLRPGDRIALGKGDLVTFLFQTPA